MYVTLVELHVKREYLDEFLAAIQKNHQSSVQETGNLRFDILQSGDDPTRFVLYEAYVSAQDATAHRLTPHFLEWQEKSAHWFASPRKATVFSGLFPTLSSLRP